MQRELPADLKEKKLIARDYFIYTFVIDTIAAGETASASVTISNDSVFLWKKTTYFCDIDGVTQTNDDRIIPLLNHQIQESSNNRTVFARSIPIASVAGTGTLPFILPEPKIYRQKNTITLSVSNYSADDTYENLYYTMIGEKLFFAGD